MWLPHDRFMRTAGHVLLVSIVQCADFATDVMVITRHLLLTQTLAVAP